MKEKILNLQDYMEKHYPHAQLLAQRQLVLPNFLQSEFIDGRNNCSLASITRVLEYHLGWNRQDIYDEVMEIALTFGFRPDYGTFPTKIDDITKEFYRRHGLKGTCRGIYMGNFYRPIQREIDRGNPLVMNVGWGYYKDHSLTVVGYALYRWRGMKIKMLAVLDGWSREVRYLDYTQLNGLYALPIFSFNTFAVTK